MAISFPVVFADLGTFFGCFANINGFAGNQANTPAANWGLSGPIVKAQSTMYANVETRLAGSGGNSGLQSLLTSDFTLSSLQGLDNTLSTAKSNVLLDAQNIIIKRVNADSPQPDSSIKTAMIEFVRQMQSQTVTVQKSVVSSTVTAGANNTGTATVMLSLTDPNGLSLENVYAESITARCTTDQNHGGTAGQETLTMTSGTIVSPTTSFLWPGGSGLNSTLNVIDTAGTGNGTSTNSNLLTGSTGTTTGAFHNGSTITQQWTVTGGSGLLSDGTTNSYFTTTQTTTQHCLKIAGDGATTVTLYQAFANGGDTTGANYTILPATIYHFAVALKGDSGNGVTIRFALVDGSNNVINNNQSVANSVSTTVGTSFAVTTAAFQTPTNLPAKVRLQITTTVVAANGKNVYIDGISLVQPPSTGPALVGSGGSSSGYGGLYAGGPYMTAFRGNVDLLNWISPSIGDQWTLAVANNMGSNSAYPLSFQPLFWQAFNMPSMGLILPSAASPSIANSNIT